MLSSILPEDDSEFTLEKFPLEAQQSLTQTLEEFTLEAEQQEARGEIR